MVPFGRVQCPSRRPGSTQCGPPRCPTITRRGESAAQARYVVVGDLCAVRGGGTRGVRVRPAAQPVRRPVAASGGPATTSTRSTAPRFRARRRSTATRPPRPSSRGAPARRLGQGRAGRAQGAGDRRRRHDGRAPRPARAAARLGRSASRGGWPARTSTAGWTASVGRSRRSTGRSRDATPYPARCRASPAGTTPSACSCTPSWSGAGRQGRRREDAEPGRLPLPDAGARLHGPHGPAHDPAVGCGLPARRPADQQRGHRALALAEAIGIVLPEGPYETLAGLSRRSWGGCPRWATRWRRTGIASPSWRWTAGASPGCGWPRRHPHPTTWRHPPARWSTGAVTGA